MAFMPLSSKINGAQNMDSKPLSSAKYHMLPKKEIILCHNKQLIVIKLNGSSIHRTIDICLGLSL